MTMRDLPPLPERLTRDAAIAWLLDNAPDLAAALLDAFRDPGPVAEILEGGGASAEELRRRSKARALGDPPL